MTATQKQPRGARCKVCGATAPRSSKGYCQPCYHATRRKPDRFCDDCGKGISRYTKSGVCNGCGNRRRAADPEFQARRIAGLRRKWEEPEHYAKMCVVAKRNVAKALCNPEWRRALSERGKILSRTVLRTPEAVAKMEACRAENGRKRTETLFAWCPQEYRARYRHLTITKRMLAADAKAQVLEEIERDRRLAVAAQSITSAIDFLKRYTAIIPRENGWLYGTTILTADELIARAEAKGWQPDRRAA